LLFVFVLDSQQVVDDKSHVVANPDPESEKELLSEISEKTMPKDLLDSVVGIFQDLRELQAQGLLDYPYSLRSLLSFFFFLSS
jgi:hypothetical protein